MNFEQVLYELGSHKNIMHHIKFQECELEIVTKWSMEWGVWACEWKNKKGCTIKVVRMKPILDFYIHF